MQPSYRSLYPSPGLLHQEYTTCQCISIALAVITLLGLLLVVGIGAAGYVKADPFIQLGLTQSIVMMASGTIFTIVGIGAIGYFLTRPPSGLCQSESTTESTKYKQLKQQWKERLNVADGHKGEYDLTDDRSGFDYNFVSDISLPTFGTYGSYGSTLIERPSLSVRLPPSQLPAFPQAIQELFKNEPRIELYVLVYPDHINKKGDRNLILHRMALPEFDISKHSWLESEIEMGIYGPQGIIEACQDEAIPFDSTKSLRAILHITGRCQTCISPNNCLFKVDPQALTSSFYTAAHFNGRAVAFYTVLLRTETAVEDFKKVENKLPDLIAFLQKPDFPFAREIKRLFAYYP